MQEDWPKALLQASDFQMVVIDHSNINLGADKNPRQRGQEQRTDHSALSQLASFQSFHYVVENLLTNKVARSFRQCLGSKWTCRVETSGALCRFCLLPDGNSVWTEPI